MFLLAETLLVSALCTSVKRPVSDELRYIGGCTSSFEISTGITLEQEVSSHLQSIEGVRRVSVQLQQDQLCVEVELWRFDKQTRRLIYAQEREFYNRFPSLAITFHIVDASTD